MEMTKLALRKLCKENGLYTTPCINDKIYLHYKGFTRIENLEEYIGLKAIWLEGNGLTTIEGLNTCHLLRCCYLHENIIETISGMENLFQMDTLNLSKNLIKKIEGLSHMTQLTTLNLAHNCIKTSEDIAHIQEMPSLQTVDLQSNKIDDASVLLVLAQLPDLRVLYLLGNPVVKKIPHYRKTVISQCQNLRYLDDRPVFDDERRRVNAWANGFREGGFEAAVKAEQEEMHNIKREKDDNDERNFLAFEEMMREGLETRRQRDLAHSRACEDTTGGQVHVNPFSGEEVVTVPENDKLKAIRMERWSGSDKVLKESHAIFSAEEVLQREEGVEGEAEIAEVQSDNSEDSFQEGNLIEETTEASTCPSGETATQTPPKFSFMGRLMDASAKVQSDIKTENSKAFDLLELD